MSGDASNAAGHWSDDVIVIGRTASAESSLPDPRWRAQVPAELSARSQLGDAGVPACTRGARDHGLQESQAQPKPASVPIPVVGVLGIKADQRDVGIVRAIGKP